MVTLERCEGDTFVARFGAEHERHGDPYDMACTVEISGTEATVKGLASPRLVTRDDYRDLMSELGRYGVRTMRIERIRGGQVTENVWRIG